MNNDKANYVLNLTQKHNDERRLGATEIVKVILSIVSVLLTVLVTLETPNPHSASLCGYPVEFLVRFAPYVFLLLCSGFCLYHLNYSLNTYHTKVLGLAVQASQESTDFAAAYDYLQRNSTFPLPYVFQKSLTIIFSLFTLALISTVFRAA